MKFIIVFSISMLSFSTLAYCLPSCDFMGISVGDEITEQQIMNKLEIKNYKIRNSDNWNDDRFKFIKNTCGTSHVICRELIDEIEGNYCDPDGCNIVSGLIIGNNIKAQASFLFDKSFKPSWKFEYLMNGTEKRIKLITVSFNLEHWNEAKKIIIEKYGNDWKTEKWLQHLSDGKSGNTIYVDEEEITHNKNGYNAKYNQYCSISAAKYDQWIHSNSIGKFHSIFGISLQTQKKF